MIRIIGSLVSSVVDIMIIYKIICKKIKYKDYIFGIIFIFITSFASELILNNDYEVDILEFLLIFFYFWKIKKYRDLKSLVGSILIVELIDLMLTIITELIDISFFKLNLNYDYLVTIFLEIVIVIIIYKKHTQIYTYLTDDNSSIFLGIIFYIYLSSAVTYYFAYTDKILSEAFDISLGLIIFQTVFSILIYIGIIKTQKNLLTKQEQKAEKEKALAKQKKIKDENKQLKEYTNYLDKNEDELRRFKHDYQNILNSLKESAKAGHIQEVVNQLDKYTNNQFDEKALRKYRGVNHIHVEELRSITIAKLAKLYNAEINYTFDCDKEIYHIPNEVNIIDLVRIIGITFDNAFEESEALVKQSNKKDMAQIDAMYYQENGNFEYEIRNHIKQRNIKMTQLSQAGYTTKQNHQGLGLSNIMQIAKKYEKYLIIEYRIQANWFVFNLTILPSEEELNDKKRNI